VAVVRELISASVSQHVGMSLDADIAAAAARSTILEKPGAVSGASRSETNMNGEVFVSRLCWRSPRSSRPERGCVVGVPALTLRTLRVALLKSTWLPTKIHHFGRS
jgi:hypothetical protein